MTQTIFHIQAPFPRKGTNEFYPTRGVRVKKTLCGQPTTSHDIRYHWQVLAIGKFVPCPDCCRVKAERQTA